MNKIVYYVATSLDGYICGENEDISGFLPNGNGVQKYLDDLKEFDTVIMGRKTYEFGYKFGLQPGALPYPQMNHFIFSETLSIENSDRKLKVSKLDLNTISSIRMTSKTDIYLCGGGDFAGWLLDNEQIDILKLKVNALLLGKGVRLFGNSKKEHQLKLLDSEKYDGGLLINTYNIKY
ncbi:MAG: dihydrofolate reductase family protein [Flavobacteriaceae bacterium]